MEEEIKMKCDYCGSNIPPGTGKLYVKKDGKKINFCSSKCEKNMLLGRKPLNVSWTEENRKARGVKNA